MNLLTWHVRGFNEPSRAREAKSFIEETGVGCFGLLENKVKEVNFSRITERQDTRWEWIHHYSSHNTGRIVIVIGWGSRKFGLSKLRETSQIIYLRVLKCNVNLVFYMSVVYASNDSRERDMLRDNLQDFQQGKTNPWIVVGDLNNVLFSYKGMGENQNIRAKQPCQLNGYLMLDYLIKKLLVVIILGLKEALMVLGNGLKQTVALLTWNGFLKCQTVWQTSCRQEPLITVLCSLNGVRRYGKTTFLDSTTDGLYNRGFNEKIAEAWKGNPVYCLCIKLKHVKEVLKYGQRSSVQTYRRQWHR